MPASHGHRGDRLRSVALTPQCRRRLQDAGVWMLGKAGELVGQLDVRSSSGHVVGASC